MESESSVNQEVTQTKKRMFKYYPSDFGDLPVKVIHMDLVFDVFETYTDVFSVLKVETLTNLKKLSLNAKNMEILNVEVEDKDITWEYRKKDDLLKIIFKDVISKSVFLVIKTKNKIRPTKNVLEGLYFDETPKGHPCTQITQCQQWGFQRLVPSFDDMTAKCTYTTTIIADSKYTNLITNGDVSITRKNSSDGRDIISYENKKVPMATYLFFLGVGTYSTFSKEFEYPDGDKFTLELLVPLNSDEIIANKSLDVLYDAILWVYLFTGKDKYKNYEISLKIRELVYQRNSSKEKTKIREELKDLTKNMHFGYKYSGEVYREIGMQNSDFGGMENVGNTTITTNRIMPFKEMTDGSWEYMVRVKCHEFYHNLNGSEVTGRSPFEIWLNEAVTVFMEEEYHAFLFGEDYARLQIVQQLHRPSGTFSQDDSPISMPVEPDGFNDANELITSMTYVKAPEFVRMVSEILGKEKFVEALELYHSRYKNKNASRKEWVNCMSEVYGSDLESFAERWLKQTSYPLVKVVHEENKLKLTQIFKDKSWSFPLKIHSFDESGVLEEKQILMGESAEVEMSGNVSINVGGSFYGKVDFEQDLYFQARFDPDIINKWLAFKSLGEKQILRVIKNKVIEEEFLNLYWELFSNNELMEKVGASILVFFEYVNNEKYSDDYKILFDAKEKILKTIAEKHKEELLRVYHSHEHKEFSGRYLEKNIKEIKSRQVKNIALSLLSKLDTKDVHDLILTQLKNPVCATDKILAFRLFMNSSSDKRMNIFKSFQNSCSSLVEWETFLSVIGGIDKEDAIDFIKKVESSPRFRITQTNDQRALYATFASNKKISLFTESGRIFLKEIIIKLAKVNEYNTLHVLKAFNTIEKIDSSYWVDLIGVLVSILQDLKNENLPSVYNTIIRFLINAKLPREKYESEKGIIGLLKDFS